jgi:large subunit ribosomal protein L9
MQIILKEDIRALGKAGEVVKVSEGFGRNCLLPQKKAVLASKGNLKTLEREIKSIQAKREEQRKAAAALSVKIAATPLTLEREAGEEDKLFGSITSRHLAEALKEKGINVDHKLIELKKPLRTLGSFGVSIHLHIEVDTVLKVEVKKK